MDKYAIILAAGKGTRMKCKRDDISKVSFPILGKPLVRYVLDALKPLDFNQIITVVGHGGEHAKSIVEDSSKVVWQTEQKGGGHAVMQVAPILEGKDGLTIVCCGDTPMLTSKTLSALLSSHETNHNDLTILTATLDDPRGYGRIVKEEGRVQRIVEQKDCTPEETLIKEINTGVYVFDNKVLFEDLKKLTPNNAQGEYYITDVIEMFVKDGLKVSSFSISDRDEILGINDRYQLANAAKIIKRRINKEHMLAGVTIEDPETTYIAPGVTIGSDTIIKPNTHIMGNSRIGEDCVLGPNTYIENSTIPSNSTVQFTQVIDKK